MFRDGDLSVVEALADGRMTPHEKLTRGRDFLICCGLKKGIISSTEPLDAYVRLNTARGLFRVPGAVGGYQLMGGRWTFDGTASLLV